VFTDDIKLLQKIHRATDRGSLIKILREIIRHDHHIIKQINRKYEQHQSLEQLRDNIKQRIKQVSGGIA